MIICGIVQSPRNNDDRLIVHQIAGAPQDPNSIINAQILLTAKGKHTSANGINGWRGKERLRNEFYLQIVTKSTDDLGRPIILGIYLKKEGKESTAISHETAQKLLNEFSLELDEFSVENFISFIACNFPGNILQRFSSCSGMICAMVVLLVTIFTVLLTCVNWR